MPSAVKIIRSSFTDNRPERLPEPPPAAPLKWNNYGAGGRLGIWPIQRAPHLAHWRHRHHNRVLQLFTLEANAVPEKVIPVAQIFPASMLRPVSPLDVWERDVFPGGGRGNPRYVNPEVSRVAAAARSSPPSIARPRCTSSPSGCGTISRPACLLAGGTAAARLESAKALAGCYRAACNAFAQATVDETAGAAAVRMSEAEDAATCPFEDEVRAKV